MPSGSKLSSTMALESRSHAHLHTCLYTCLHAYLPTCLYTCIHICIHTCTHTCLHTCLYTVYKSGTQIWHPVRGAGVIIQIDHADLKKPYRVRFDDGQVVMAHGNQSYSHRLYSYGLHSCGLCRYGLCSCGLYSHGLYSNCRTASDLTIDRSTTSLRNSS